MTMKMMYRIVGQVLLRHEPQWTTNQLWHPMLIDSCIG